MKHIKHWLATMAVLLCSITASAHYFEVGGIYYDITSSSDLTVAVTYRGDYYYDYSEYSGAVTIPSTVTYNSKTYSVTSIESRAFSSCSSLTDITLPEGLTSIGSNAFSDCSHLTAITLPESVTSIGDYAFSGCSSLTSITLPEGVTSIGDHAFRSCRSLTSITLPENSQLTSIGNFAFYNCRSLTAVHISSLEAWCNIDFGGFSANPLSCAKNLYLNGELVTELAIPNSVTAIKNHAFEDCSSLTSITLPEGVTSIGERAFRDCISLTSITSYAVVPPTCYASTFASVDTSIPVYVPEESVADYQSAEVWKEFFNIFSVETGIEAPEIIDEESETIYDLHGRRVENPTKGIYIIGGRKVVIK